MQEIIESYFYIDTLVSELEFKKEYIIPFPRITFGYFFNSPFLVSHINRNEHIKARMIISRITTDPITVMPLTDRVRILGAHLPAWGLAAFTDEDISQWPWLIDTKKLFGDVAKRFRNSVDQLENPEDMFEVVEAALMETMTDRNLSGIRNITQAIEKQNGNISVGELADRFYMTTRTLRNHFYRYIGCSPKEFLQVVKIKQSVNKMRTEDQSLTELSYDHHFADQAHFTHTVRQLTGLSPKQIQSNLDGFRFLQF